MKKLFILILLLSVSLTIFANGGEEEKPVTVTALIAGNPAQPNGKTLMEVATEKLHQDFPNAIVEFNIADLSEGSTLTMDAMLAAGNAPNVYSDYIGRTSKYMVPEYALPLNDYVTDLDQYFESVMKPLTINGDVMGLPTPGGIYAMCINLDLLEDVGYDLPSQENWTVDEFLKMCAMVKAKYDGEKWGTGMFAANQSGDYLINNWFASFGVSYYADGYDYTTIKSTGGAKVYEFFQSLVENDYIPPNSGTLADDYYVTQWAKGELAATGFFEGWTENYFKSWENEIKNKETEETYGRFSYTFYPFPKAEGVDKVPAYFINHTVVVHNTGDRRTDEVAARLAQYLNDADIQENASLSNVCLTRKDAENLSDSVMIPVITKIGEDNGIFDVGLSQPWFAAVRPKHYPILQKVLAGDLTPEEAITAYEAAINEELE